ncbi:hypothetical protein GCK72_017688 [Caenorhabditis remanei]|uniref:G-protein coupled receptors family 1 profile domain-containing protein n=1 Tax=Caenorhabditis remanei TaxID=31234 RepID=A0A6A5G960_CAERE|nr:hypothetical protein GCK72_017688 [Caenorhabditis remanei]KAF1751134.1 hypothetical protein GCK72_017688 [Caenorhabditis remanei]
MEFLFGTLFQNDCSYKYNAIEQKFKLYCPKVVSGIESLTKEPPEGIRILENVIQVGIPVVILVLYIALVIRVIKLKRSKRNTHEIIIVKQAFFIFVMFQIYYIVTLFGKTLYINVATAFYLKRAIHTAEIFAGAATPCIVFSTSREIRKIVSSRIGDGSAGKVPSTIKGISFRQS